MLLHQPFELGHEAVSINNAAVIKINFENKEIGRLEAFDAPDVNEAE
jgi:hypothetical protein